LAELLPKLAELFRCTGRKFFWDLATLVGLKVFVHELFNTTRTVHVPTENLKHKKCVYARKGRISHIVEVPKKEFPLHAPHIAENPRQNLKGSDCKNVAGKMT
jgi:hypothetical protein